MLDWIGDAVSGAVADMLNGILEWFKGVVAGFAGSCIDVMNDFLGTAANSGVFTYALNDPVLNRMLQTAWNICENVAMPVGYGLLGLMVAIEFAGIARNLATQNSLTFFEALARFLIKMMVWKTFLDYTPLLMNGIYEFVRNVTRGVQRFAAAPDSSGQLTAYTIDKQPIMDVIDGISGDQFLWLVVAMLLLVVALLCTAGASIFVQIIALGRYLEIFVLMSLAAIPNVTMVSESTRHIGQGYLTWFLSACVQGTVLVLFLAFFSPLFSAGAIMLGNAIDGTSGASFAALLNGIAQPLVFSVVMIVSLMHSREIANRLTGAM